MKFEINDKIKTMISWELDTNESKASESKTVTFSTDYSLSPQISYIPDTMNTVPILAQQISHDPGTISATQGLNPPISLVSDSFYTQHSQGCLVMFILSRKQHQLLQIQRNCLHGFIY